MEKISKFVLTVLLILLPVFIFGYVVEVIACDLNNLAETTGIICDRFDKTTVIKYNVDGKEYYSFVETRFPKYEVGEETTVVYSKIIPNKVKLKTDKIDIHPNGLFIVMATFDLAAVVLIGIIRTGFSEFETKRVLATYCGRKYFDKTFYYEFKFEEDGRERFVYSEGDPAYKEILKDCNINKVYCDIRLGNYCKPDFEGTLAEKNIVVCLSTRSTKDGQYEDDPIKGD